MKQYLQFDDQVVMRELLGIEGHILKRNLDFFEFLDFAEERGETFVLLPLATEDFYEGFTLVERRITHEN